MQPPSISKAWSIAFLFQSNTRMVRTSYTMGSVTRKLGEYGVELGVPVCLGVLAVREEGGISSAATRPNSSIPASTCTHPAYDLQPTSTIMFFSTSLFTVASFMAALVAATPVAEKAGETVRASDIYHIVFILT